MRICLVLLSLAIIAATPAVADTVTLEQRYKPSKFRDLDRRIDPNAAVYGLPFGSSEEQTRATFGAPRGVILLNEGYKLYLYGKSHFFVFRRGKFIELNVDRHAAYQFDGAGRMERHPFFDGDRWEIIPGLRIGMTFDQVRKVLKKPDMAPDYTLVVDGENSTMTLKFTGTYGATDADSYKFSGFSILYYGS